MNIKHYTEICHAAAVKGGWWTDLKTGRPLERDKGEMYALMHSEISEALEGIRKNKQDDHLPHRKSEEVELADFLIRIFDYAGGFDLNLYLLEANILPDTSKGSLIAEMHGILSDSYYKMSDGDNTEQSYLSEVLSFVVQYGQKFGLDLEDAINEKMAYNAQRADHKIENRVKQGGKAF